MQNYYQNQPVLSHVYLRNNLPKRKYGTYVINLDEYESLGIHWIALYLNGDNVTYFYNLELNTCQKKFKNS